MSTHKVLMAHLRAEEIYQRKKIERALDQQGALARALEREFDRARRFCQPDISEILNGIPDPEAIAEARIEAEEQKDERNRAKAEGGRKGAAIKRERQSLGIAERNQRILKRHLELSPINESWAEVIARESGISARQVRNIINQFNNSEI